MIRVQAVADALAIAGDPAAPDNKILYAADILVSFGRLDVAEELLNRLRPNGAFKGYVNRLSAAANQLRRSGILNELAALGDDQEALVGGQHEAFTARHHGGSDKVILVFTGLDPRFWLSLMLLHLFLKKLDTHIIYLSDFRKLLFLDGLESVAKGYHGLLEKLREAIRGLHANKIYVMAQSAGGFAGLRYAMDLGATSFLGMSIRTDLSDDGRIPIGDFFRRPVLREVAPEMLIDLKPMLVRSKWPERVTLFSGDSNPVDRPHAEHLADLPNVEVHMIRDYRDHDVISALVAAGRFEDVLRRFVGQQSSQ